MKDQDQTPQHTHTLTSGLKVRLIEQPKGKHLRKAQQMIGKDQSLLQFALACQLIEFDGKMKTMEDFDDMNMTDAAECMLLATTGGLNTSEIEGK